MTLNGGIHGLRLIEAESKDSGITHCTLTTSYQHSFPFLPEELSPQNATPGTSGSHDTAYNVSPLAQYLFSHQTTSPSRISSPRQRLPYGRSSTRRRSPHIRKPTLLALTQEFVNIITQHERLRSKFGDDQLAISKAWHDFVSIKPFDYHDGLGDFAPGVLVKR